MKQVAIIGGGPSGSALAIKLARSGIRTAIFHSGKRPELIVGESLIPAVIPIIRDLGIEDAMKPFSVFKPGATVWLSKDERASIVFSQANGDLPPYAYQTPRDKFDELLLDKAAAEGARIFPFHATLEQVGSPSIISRMFPK